MATLAEKLEGLQCPRCGRVDTYVIRDVEHTEKVGDNTVTVMITAGVCTNCWEQALDSAATAKVERAADQLRTGATKGLVHMGEAYRVP